MDLKSSGVALIFDHENFHKSYVSQRIGTEFDSKALKSCFSHLGFEAIVHKDLCSTEIKNEAIRVANMDHSDNNCFVMCVLTHGNENDLFAYDTIYQHKDVIMPFQKCPTLDGKPKIFFFQACRGDESDQAVTVNHVNSSPFDTPFSIPPDFVIAFSTVHGCISWRNPKSGTLYIQSLVKELKKSAYHHDLLSILTSVNRKVAINCKTYKDGDEMFRIKQLPCILSRTTKLIQFTHKKNLNLNILSVNKK